MGEGSLHYLRIIAQHISGYKPGEIAANLGISESTVSNALKSPEGVALLNEAKRRMKENVFGRIESELLELAETGVQNLRETIDAQFVPGSRGKIHQDHMSLKLLGVIGYTEDSLGDRKRSSLVVNKELGDRLMAALTKADQAAQLHSGRDVTEIASTNGEVKNAEADN